MILNIGIDSMDARMIERYYQMYLDRFTVAEREECESRENRMCAYAKRFAAKEACIKALGVNDAIGGVHMREIEVNATSSGRPHLTLTGGALRQLQAITPHGRTAKVHVSITDMNMTASAVVVIEAL